MTSTNVGVSVAGTSQSVLPAVSVQPQGTVKFVYTLEQTAMANALEIPSEMRRTGTVLTLPENYARYLALLEAQNKFKEINKNGTWPVGLRKPNGTDIKHLFIGKSTWHDSWSKTFPHLNAYPEMVKWLNEEDDALEDQELWGSNLSGYHFPELIDWVKKGGSLKKGKKGAANEVVPAPSTLKNAGKASTSKKSAGSSKKSAGSSKKLTSTKAGTSKRKL
jgi:hypothetical protein